MLKARFPCLAFCSNSSWLSSAGSPLAVRAVSASWRRGQARPAWRNSRRNCARTRRMLASRRKASRPDMFCRSYSFQGVDLAPWLRAASVPAVCLAVSDNAIFLAAFCLLSVPCLFLHALCPRASPFAEFLRQRGTHLFVYNRCVCVRKQQ